MRQTRWQPYNPLWNQLQQLQSEMNHLFDRWDRGDGQTSVTAEYPPLNIWEETDALHVEAELPGIDLKDLEIYVTGERQLTIKGERRPVTIEKGTWHRQERGFGAFARVLTLPIEVNREKVEARLENGILTITLPKRESAKPRKITVKAE
ncbi:MAG TPA: Hsp20 family protein [Gemmataceae bacterium]|nr:Hsp20 family protein [Gemmataceae bacterium]